MLGNFSVSLPGLRVAKRDKACGRIGQKGASHGLAMACFAVLVYMPVVFGAMALTCTVTSRSHKNKSPGTPCRTLRVPGGSLNTTDTMAASATTLAGNMASQGTPFLLGPPRLLARRLYRHTTRNAQVSLNPPPLMLAEEEIS